MVWSHRLVSWGWIASLCFMGLVLTSCLERTPGTPSEATTGTAAPALPPRPPSWRREVELSGTGWKLWRDKDAVWQNDQLFLPPVDVSKLPVNPPSVGWQAMLTGATPPPATGTAPARAPGLPPAVGIGPKNPIKDVQVPGTVEEYFWGADGDSYGTAGHYQGVSFWWREFEIPADLAGKKLVLHFASCRLRSEVFVNEQLVGYDLIGNTPFDVDISTAAKTGQKNRLCVRITDPNGNEPDNNFDYADFLTRPWGNTRVRIPPSHAFGGITGRVTLRAFDAVRIADVFVKNKPSPSPSHPTDIDVDIALQNDATVALTGEVRLRIVARDAASTVLLEQAYADVPLPIGTSLLSKSLSTPTAKLWDTTDPNLYRCEVSVQVKPAVGPPARDAQEVVFGYRWFTPDGVGTPDACLRLNGKRVFVRSAISWGYWPINGMFPTPQLAERQVRMAKAMGLNMLHMHRAIADPQVLEAADEVGLLLYSEPGGYKCDRGDANARAMATEKLMRFIRRDRNHPSVVIWGMINEIWVRENLVHDEYLRDMTEVRKLDPTRTLVLASGQTVNGRPDPRGSWMMPLESQRREVGWRDEHHAGSVGLYMDNLYSSPDSFYLHEGEANAIIMMGEEGAISSPPQLDAMAADYKERGLPGWDGADNERLRRVYNEWLDAHHARSSFATVDDLCRALGDIAYYYHGRVIENVRAWNITDGYVINGWECTKLDNHSGIVDPFRRPKGDVSTLAYYLRPLYVAVKARKKLLEVGSGGVEVVDFFLINEKDVKGPHTLEITASDPDGKEVLRKTVNVQIQGGDQYGQLLSRDVVIPAPSTHGYLRIEARLLSDGKLIADGHDEALAVDYRSLTIPSNGEVLENGSEVKNFLANLKYTPAPAGHPGPTPFVAVGRYRVNTETVNELLLRVHDDGVTLILLDQAERWAQELASRKIVKYDGSMAVGNNWIGGNYFLLADPLLTGLPQNCGMSWPYQVLCGQWQPNGGRRGLLLTGDDAAAGCYTSNDPRMGTILGSIKYGNGRIVITTLPILQALGNGDPTAATAKRIFVNSMVYCTVPAAETPAASVQR
jgi:hypothetical protein